MNLHHLFKRALILPVLFFCLSANAQADLKPMAQWQDSLLSLGRSMYRLPGETERMEKNFSFVKTLVSALKEKNSYAYDFEALDMISILRSPDDRFRIFSWNIPLGDGSYLYYGSIQIKTADGKLSLLPLLDKTFEIEDPDNAILSNSTWYGAQYMDIIPLDRGYILLGWKGHAADYTQKVIEPLQFDGSKFTLGKNIFSDNPKMSRKIFNYSKQVTMHLQYHAERKAILFDHLVPPQAGMEGQYQYYGPDLSFDSYELAGDKLILKEDVEFLNPNAAGEASDIQPGKAIPNKKSGL